jgi:hypothetical protein
VLDENTNDEYYQIFLGQLELKSKKIFFFKSKNDLCINKPVSQNSTSIDFPSNLAVCLKILTAYVEYRAPTLSSFESNDIFQANKTTY